MTLPLLASGAVGVIGVATHWTGPDHQEMFDLWEKGDVVGARLVNARLLESFAFETGDDAPNPMPTKAHDAGSSGCRSARPACRWARRRRPWSDRAREVLANLRAVARRVPRPP